MVTIETQLIEAKKDGRGRRITTKAEREAIVRSYWESGLKQRAFAEREGIKYVTFTAWVQEFRDCRPVVKPPRFAEVQLPAGRAGLEVVLASGVVVRGGTAAEVAELVRLLRC
jgi:transposase-like protein